MKQNVNVNNYVVHVSLENDYDKLIYLNGTRGVGKINYEKID